MDSTEPRQRLLLALAEQLKLPLVQIARGAEMADITNLESTNRSITSTADIALRLIDGYILSIMPSQAELSLEPVSISAVLQDTAHRLSRLAKDYNCNLEVSIRGKNGPIMANKKNIEAAYTMLGYSIIQAQNVEGKIQRVLLAAHKSPAGLVAGIFGSQPGLTSELFRRSMSLYGVAKQPLTATSASGGAGIFIADSLLQSMNTPLHTAKHNKLTGLAATLLPSYQLQFSEL